MKRIKKLLGLALTLTLSLGMVACSSSKGDEKEVVDKLQQIKDSGKIVLATSAEYSPYEFHTMVDGKDTIVGFDVMIAQEIADEIGVESALSNLSGFGVIQANTTSAFSAFSAPSNPSKSISINSNSTPISSAIS